MRNKLVLTGLAAALTVSVVSALNTSQANQIPSDVEKATTSESSSTSKAKTDPPELDGTLSVTEQADDADVVKVGESQPQEQVSDKPAIAKIHSYEKEGRPAATLYVKNIPIVTFLGAEKAAAETAKVATTKSEESDVSANPQDPVWRATTVAAKINQLDRNGIDANNIKVVWDKQRQSYVIQTDDEHILEMSKLTILPKTTQDMGDDALKITNLLRRQIGDADALKDIPGRPKPPAPQVAAASVLYQVSGEASWYGPGFHGNYTANGEVYNQYALTAAHKTLPFGTRVKVTNLYNGRSVVVRINDRGPFIPGRVIDLSQGAAQVIGVTSSGVAPVRMDILQ
ncbi:septal ring lytic transglycosylase RlpA family protein [Acaryochloris sp. IP29b_bin.137]|uniref:septal ring lytic transglycosylase RlpA family protein n=1 Tax=Acaryochloris sp. IP29b_bin.137 TaxID=2969217 RepID=UPI002619BB0A|nr:septal ring lytic transglycosylase RlpA family protein [Acaryochloris sp. IP29b_bin.137]